MKVHNKGYYISFSIKTVLALIVLADAEQTSPKLVYLVSRIINVYDRQYGWPRPGSEIHVDIRCTYSLSYYALPKNVKLTGIYFYECYIPNSPLADKFNESHIDYSSMNKLQFTNNTMGTPFPKNFTSGLPIKSLEIWNPKNFHVTNEFFTSLTKLREITFGQMDVPTLPPSTDLHLEILILKYANVKNWDNCENLQQLHLEGMNPIHIPKVWPTSCNQLKTLHLENLTPETVQYLMDGFNGTALGNLESLTVRNCSLVQLPFQLMFSARNFTHLDLSGNNLDDDAIFQMPTMDKLETLDLSNEKSYTFTSKALIHLVPKIPAVRELKLIHISVVGDKEESALKTALPMMTSLEKLWIDRIFPKKDKLMHVHFPKLTFLSWMYGGFTGDMNHLKLYSLPSTGANKLEVDLRRTSAQYVSIAPDFIQNYDYYEARTRHWLTNKGYKLIVKLDSIDCDCTNDVLARALKEFPHFLAMPDLKCSQGGLFKDEPIEHLSCTKATVNGCTRRINRDISTFTTIVDCSYVGEKFRWPQPKGFRFFNATGNRITSIDKAYLPDSLEGLDLRNNSISRLNGEQSARLFGNKGRSVWLSGNPIICDCDNQPLLDALRVNQSLIQDYDNLTCADSNKLLSLVSVAELCRPKSVTMSASLSVMALVILITALLIRHFWSSIRMILYAHGLCLSCFSEEDVDVDRPYDAFISFAHGDDQYVMEYLLPKLEGEPNFYRLCVHYRDWSVGQWIPAQIMQSVRISKRTIIVLSKNFVQSCWGMLEFRHAHAGAMADGRQRLLVLVLDDVLSEQLPPELQGYLELNTYLKCSDMWFWEKLRYAMPHKKNEGLPPKRHFMAGNGQNKFRAGNRSGLELEALSMEVSQPVNRSGEIPSNSYNVEMPTE